MKGLLPTSGETPRRGIAEVAQYMGVTTLVSVAEKYGESSTHYG